jgi:hypothetical protein
MSAARHAWRWQQLVQMERSGHVDFTELDRLERLYFGKPRPSDFIDRDAEEDRDNERHGGW